MGIGKDQIKGMDSGLLDKAEAAAVEKKKTVVEPAPRPEDAEEPGRPGGGLRIAGLATAGAGVVALGLGVKFGLDASSAESDVEEQWDPDRFDDGEAANRNMIIMYSVGITAIVGGGALYYLGSREGTQSEERQLSIAPAITPDSASLVFAGRF